MKIKYLFLTLRVFSATGGIEKVCRVAGKALYELGLQFGGQVKIYSMHGPRGKADGNKYFPQLIFTGFGRKRIRFVLKSVNSGRKSRVVILSHINLLPVGWMIKKFKPSVKLVLLAHGIEIWDPLSRIRRKMLHACDLILPVSRFTKDRIKELHGIPENRLVVINNCLDPFMERSLFPGRNEDLLKLYGLNKNSRILLTVSRMADTERYKGYDKVLLALPALTRRYPELHYLLAGSYDAGEKARIDELIIRLNLQEKVSFTGFVPDEELAAHFLLADIFVMPSEKEGFGIVFIEAMYYGVPVIAGNKDGSADALLNGEMGTLVDPGNVSELTEAIGSILDNPNAFLPDQDKLIEHFGYMGYKERFGDVFGELMKN